MEEDFREIQQEIELFRGLQPNGLFRVNDGKSVLYRMHGDRILEIEKMPHENAVKIDGNEYGLSVSRGIIRILYVDGTLDPRIIVPVSPISKRIELEQLIEGYQYRIHSNCQANELDTLGTYIGRNEHDEPMFNRLNMSNPDFTRYTHDPTLIISYRPELCTFIESGKTNFAEQITQGLTVKGDEAGAKLVLPPRYLHKFGGTKRKKRRSRKSKSKVWN